MRRAAALRADRVGNRRNLFELFLEQSLKVAAYEGARAAIVPKSNVSSVTYNSNQILKARHVNDGRVSVIPPNFDGQPYGTIIKVSVSAPCDSNSLFPPTFYAGRTLTGEVEMMKEY